MEEKMLKLVPVICLLGAASLVLVCGCTPEANKTWSESQNFGDYLLGDWSGTYSVSSSLDASFASITIYQTGGSLQGFDNLKRTWAGTIVAATNPGINLETKDPDGSAEVLAGHFELVLLVAPDIYWMTGTGQHWTSSNSGTFFFDGPVIVIPVAQ
jgi:hypothetical protein